MTACVILATLQLIGAVLSVGSESYSIAVSKDESSGTMTTLHATWMFYSLMIVVTAILVFAAVHRKSSALVVPHIIMQAVGVVVSLLRVILASYLISTSSQSLPIAILPFNGTWNVTWNAAEIEGVVAAGAAAGVGFTVAVGVISIGLSIWFTLLFAQLKRHLDVKQAGEDMKLVDGAKPPVYDE